MPHIDDVLDGLEPYRDHIDLVVDRTAAETVERAQQALDDAKKQDSGLDQPQVEAAEQALAEAVEQARPKVVRFEFVNIGRNRWVQLQRTHPPTEAEREVNPRAPYDAEKFPLAAVAASCVAPEGMTVEKVSRLAEGLSNGQWHALWATCLNANVGASPVPLSLTSSNETASSEKK